MITRGLGIYLTVMGAVVTLAGLLLKDGERVIAGSAMVTIGAALLGTEKA